MTRKWVIVGSVAARHWYPDWREPKDIDLLTPATITTSDQQTIYIDAQWHRLGETLLDRSLDRTFLDADLLFTLKVSHSYWPIHWDKTMYDIHQFQVRGCRLQQDLHDDLVRLWTEVHGAKRVNMAQSRDTFWQDAVVRRYDHEWLHEQVAFHGRPLHERVRRNPTSVWVSRDLFDDLPPDLQTDLILEEVLVTAIERFDLTVASTKVERLRAVTHAHRLLCTSMTKGWFAQQVVLSTYNLLVTQRPRWYNHLHHVLQHLPGAQP